MTCQIFKNYPLRLKNSDEELKLLESAIENMPVAVYMADVKNSHIYHNRRFTELLGYTIKDLENSSLDRLYTDTETNQNALKTIVPGESWFRELEVADKSGRNFPVLIQTEAIKDEDNTFLFFVGGVTAMTRQRKIEKELDNQREYLSTLHSISLGMFRRLKLSELLKAILVRASKATGIPNGFFYLYDPDENVLEIQAGCGNLAPAIGSKIAPGQGFAGKVFETGEPMIIDNYRLWPEKIPAASFEDSFSIAAIPLISGSKIEGVIGLSNDREDVAIDPDIIEVLEEFAAIARIAVDNARLFDRQNREFERRISLEKERKEMEARLHQSQRMESIGTLAGGIAHDFNNILSAIMGFTQLAMDDAQENRVRPGDLNEVYKASLRAKDLVQQILTYARQSEESVYAIKVSLIIKEVLKFIRSTIPSTISIEQNITSQAKVLADATQLYQIFLNLLTNASQAMESNGGKLSVDMVDQTLDSGIESLEPGDYIRIIISDTGTGIAKEDILKIFEPYFTTKQKGDGTGLGLAVVHGAVKSMGGDIFVESVVGQGTGFTLYLPVAKKGKPEFTKPEETAPSGNGDHVLFVDDEAPITKIGKRILESLNYGVTTLNSSLEALEFFRSNPGEVQAVVTDMTMPNMTGDKLAEALKKIRPDIPVILCTGYHQEISGMDLTKTGIHCICKKPISKTELAVAVRTAIDGNLKNQR